MSNSPDPVSDPKPDSDPDRLFLNATWPNPDPDPQNVKWYIKNTT
jgi:hypothetical protein